MPARNETEVHYGLSDGPAIHCACIALEPGHPYLKLPLKFATSLRRALLNLVAASAFDRLLEAVEMELDAPTAGG